MWIKQDYPTTVSDSISHRYATVADINSRIARL
jgi:hypothetical protein